MYENRRRKGILVHVFKTRLNTETRVTTRNSGDSHTTNTPICCCCCCPGSNTTKTTDNVDCKTDEIQPLRCKVWGISIPIENNNKNPVSFQCCFTSTVQCCFTSTETIRLIRDGEPRAATSTFTQLLRSDLRPQKPSGLLWTGSPGQPHPDFSFTQLLSSEVRIRPRAVSL